MDDARATYDKMLRNQVARSLRDLGFRGSPPQFWLKSDASWGGIGFQKDRHSTEQVVWFTINVMAIDKVRWAQVRQRCPWLPRRPSPNVSYLDDDGQPIPYTERVGFLLAEQADRWWQVNPADDLRTLAAEILGLVETKVFRNCSVARGRTVSAGCVGPPTSL